MPRRDVVLTGLLAFGAGVAVGANWGKLRKKIGPVLEKMGLQLADLGDLISAAGVEEFVPEMAAAKPRRPRSRAKSRDVEMDESFTPADSTRRRTPLRAVRSPGKRKAARRKPMAVPAEETPLATGTFGA